MEGRVNPAVKNIQNLSPQLQQVKISFKDQLPRISSFTVEAQEHLLMVCELETLILDSNSSKIIMSEKLFDFFKYREQRLKNTNADESVKPTSAANVLCRQLSIQYEDFFQISAWIKHKPSAFELRHPTLQVEHQLKNNKDYQPLRWVRGEDNALIDIGNCLKQAKDSQDGKYRATENNPKVTGRVLLVTEIDKVIRHSFAVEQWVKSEATLSKIGSDHLDELLNNANYQTRNLYGEEGDARLQQNVLNDFVRQFDTLHDPLLVLKVINTTALKNFMPCKDMRKLKPKDLQSDNEQLYRAKLLVLTEVYRRSKQKEFSTTLLGNHKLPAVEVYQTFLISQYPLNEFEGYIREKESQHASTLLEEKKTTLGWKSVLFALVSLSMEWTPAFGAAKVQKKVFNSGSPLTTAHLSFNKPEVKKQDVIPGIQQSGSEYRPNQHGKR